MRLRNDNSGDSVFVYQPGGKAGGNVYVTEASLKAAWDAVSGPKTMLVDDSIAATHLSLAWNLDNATIGIEFNSGGVLILDPGMTLTGTGLIRFVAGITVQSNALAPVFVSSAGFAFIVLEESSTIESTTASAVFRLSAGGSLSIFGVASFLGDGTHPVLTVDAGQTANVTFLTDAEINTNAIAGAGAATIQADASTTVGAQTITSPILTRIDLASQVAFAPSVPGNWQPAPTLAGPALDQLAAPNFQQASGNTGTGTATVTVTAPAISKKKNGQMTVIGSILCTASLATTLTVQLQKDGVLIDTAESIPLALGAAIGVPISFIDTAADAAAHVYSLKATAGAGTLSVAANSAKVRVSEG